MIEIENLDHQGRGIAHINNKIVFIENALPNEIVETKIIKEHKNFNESIVTKYIKKSVNRIDPICPYYKECGGCNIMHMPYDKQLEFKQNKINNIINKYLKNDILINKIVKSDYKVNYRNKITFQVNKDIGFFKKNSNELIKIDKCILCDELINNSIKYLSTLDLSKIEKIICKSNKKDLMIIIETNDINLNIDKLIPHCKSIYLKQNNKYILKYGEKQIKQNIGNINYLISPDSFFQINLDVTKKLYDKIKSIVGTNKNIIDLYCGTGSIGIYISKDNNVYGIEINEQAINDAKINKKINNIQNIEFILGDSGKKIKNLTKKIDTIIVDPPRNGLNKETINNILNINPKNIIYVSCDPMTLVRDLKVFSNNYDIVEITPFDMFPNTYHVECLVQLKLKNK